MKLLIDTDIGDDIDDVLAIGIAIKKGIDVVGITTVYRNAELRAEIVKSFLRKIGRADIPVISGYSDTLSKNASVRGKFHYLCGAKEGKDKSSGEQAVDFIIDCALKYGKDLTVLSIGAETNIAKAYLKAPNVMKNVGACVIMGGAFWCQYDEWNIICDPMAGKIVGDSDMPVFYVPHDVTKNVSIGAENYERVLKGGFDKIGNTISELFIEWSKNGGWLPLLHDPIALYFVLEPSKFVTEKIRTLFIGEGELAGLSLNLNKIRGCFKDKTVFPEVNVVSFIPAEFIINDLIKTLF